MNCNGNNISRRIFLDLLAKGTVSTLFLGGFKNSIIFDPNAYANDIISYSKLPRWRGFNLTDKEKYEKVKSYNEWDFDTIKEWGFNFVRLPLDYRIWTPKAYVYDEKALKEIDQAIKWARDRQIHVNICLHHAPGYGVNSPKEAFNLWADGQSGDEARSQFAAQWEMLSERYRGIPSSALSFNLVNEPPGLKQFQYLRVATLGVNAIWDKDCTRLIIADGYADGWYGAARPATELADLNVAQSMHGYRPLELTHYKASWIGNAEKWPVPTWPLTMSLSQYLYGDQQPEFRSSLVLTGQFPKGSRFTIRVYRVGSKAQLLIRADGTKIMEIGFNPGAGKGDWKKSTFMPDGNYYDAIYDKEYSAILPEDTSEIELAVVKGYWLMFSELRVEPFQGAQRGILTLTPNNMEWGKRQKTYLVDNTGKITAQGPPECDKRTLWKDEIVPWRNFVERGIGIHVGEWGVHRFTPHDVTLSYMKDRLDLWKKTGWGWALWNLRGPFGPFDSKRTDVRYEIYKGHKLDRKMLELLSKG